MAPTAESRDLENRLRAALDGEVLFDRFSRGRYSTDASIYQIEPIGVVLPRNAHEALAALSIATELGVPILPRGAGTSQCGQAVGEALIIDNAKYLNEVSELDLESKTAWVEPGVVLDDLNGILRPHGLCFPVDISTAAQATIGGMTANNSCGARSIRYGNMVHNVLAVDAWLTSGESPRFGDVGAAESPVEGRSTYQRIVEGIRALYAREQQEFSRRVPAVLRKVAGYNLDMAASGPFNMAHLLVGSEGTLGYFRRIKLRLAPTPKHRVLGIAHFPSFYRAMEMSPHIVRLGPAAVELVDRTMIDLARRQAEFSNIVDHMVRGQPDAILLVEFAGDDRAEQVRSLKELSQLLADMGLPDSVIEVEDAKLQTSIWGVRKAGLNIMMSMKGDGKPVSFIEDCAVPLEHLADYTSRLSEVFDKHGTQGTWYAHASVGCLHVRPVLNMRTEDGARKMRAIAEEACAMVREYKGSFSGEHGDGLVRSEWIEPVYGPKLTQAFREIKALFDPKGLMNPGKIVSPGPMDDRRSFRFKPGYETLPLQTGLDWSEHEIGEHNAGRGFAAAVEMCNNNGHCRKFDAGTMCPSYRVTRDEQHLTRGRANSLRLALSGQLGKEALTAREMYRTMALCVGCKGCRRECPTGVDMAAMKVEFLYQYHQRYPRSLKDRLIAHLPRYAPGLARLAPVVNLQAHIPGAAALLQKLIGLSARRTLPIWRRDFYRGQSEIEPGGEREVVLLADTFNTFFEPENLRAAARVLRAADYRVTVASAGDGGRRLCCGRTFLAAGMIEEARGEAKRVITALSPFINQGAPVIGLEPACLLTLRDEFSRLVSAQEVTALAENALTFEEFLARENRAGRLALRLGEPECRRALVHGHCHQKAFGLMPSVVESLSLIPGLQVETLESSCCGMAGDFGYDARHFETSMQMAELSLLPAIRNAATDTVIVADGTSCRHQIRDGCRREACHVARVLAECL